MAIEAGRTSVPKSGIKISSMSGTAVREPVSHRTMIVLRVATDAGIEGVAEMKSGPDVQATLASVRKRFDDLIGRDAQARQFLLWDLAKSKGASGTFNAALGMALLDIAGKISEAPIFQILSGQTRSKARALARLEGSS